MRTVRPGARSQGKAASRAQRRGAGQLTSLVSPPPMTWRRSEWPRMTHGTARSHSISALQGKRAPRSCQGSGCGTATDQRDAGNSVQTALKMRAAVKHAASRRGAVGCTAPGLAGVRTAADDTAVLARDLEGGGGAARTLTTCTASQRCRGHARGLHPMGARAAGGEANGAAVVGCGAGTLREAVRDAGRGGCHARAPGNPCEAGSA